MQRSRFSPLALILLGMFTFGASCDGGRHTHHAGAHGASGSTASAGTQDGPTVDHVPGVDVSQLTSSEKRVWTDLINDQLSPCGDPVTVGQCTSQAHGCGKCVPAARYLSRLVAEGYDKSEIEDLYRVRYGRESLVDVHVGDSPVRGSPMAPVTIVEFSDFQCPYCGAAEPILRRVVREHEGRVRLVFKNYPLPAHEHAMAAARAAEAARKQGKFWEMHDLLFDNQTHLEPDDIDRYAQQLHLDMDRFHTDVQSEDVQQSIEADKAEGHRVGIEGTPTMFIDGHRFKERTQSLPAYIDEEIDQQ